MHVTSRDSASDNHLSVAVCTYNRADSLGKTLKSLQRQEFCHEMSWELLVIDNNSTDGTSEVVGEFEPALPLRYVFEPAQGLSAARNRALREFRGELLIFTDDDVVLDPGWLSAYAAASRKYPEVGYFGGRILPHWADGPPGWLVDPSLSLISGLLVRYDLGTADRWLQAESPQPFGASFALRRCVTEQLDPFRLDLGVVGDSAGRGEEAEYLRRARKAGFRGVYLGDAVCYHTQNPARFHVDHLFRYGVEKGKAELLMGCGGMGSRSRQAGFIVRGLWQLFKGRGDRFRQCVINMGIQQALIAGRASSEVHLTARKSN